MMPLSRRHALLGGLFGTGMVGLRALATGLPASFLLNPRLALADDPPATDPQFLIVSTSGSGDSINCNVPGTYDLPATFPSGSVVHPDTPEMVETELTLGATKYKAAKPWSTLSKEVLGRTCFFHHGSLTANHGDESRVLKMMGAVRRDEMLLSFLAKKLAPQFSTVQTEPVALGAETMQFEGKYQPRLSPTGLKAVLSPATGLAFDLQKIRDTDLDAMNKLLKESHATKAERNFLDQMALSQAQVRKLSDQFATDVAAIKGDGADDQSLAAALLVRMKVTPVVVMHIPFSGDNHTDTDWVAETTQTVAGLASMNRLFTKLKEYGLLDQATFALLNVFGRELGTPIEGRAHNPAHNVGVLIGKGFKPGVVGGITPKGAASEIDSATGQAKTGGDVTLTSSLASFGKTLARGVGISEAALTEEMTDGIIVKGALA